MILGFLRSNIKLEIKIFQVSLMSSATWEEMHLNATDGILVQKSVKVPCIEQT